MTVRMPFTALRSEIATHVEARGSQIVAISGFGGAGKSTLAAALAKEFEPAAVVSADDFILGQLGERCPDWRSIDRRRLVRTVLDPARRGSPIRYQQYDWANDRLGEERKVPSAPLLLVEGVGIMHPDLLPYFDLTVWIDCPLEIAAERGRLRARENHGVDQDALWRDVWVPNDRDYFDQFRPDLLADVIYEASLLDRRSPDAEA